MKITQLTHHDLDGYGASTVAAAYADVSRVVHVSRYADVGPLVDAELQRLTRAKASECLLLTDLGLEPPTVTFVKAFAAMNLKRPDDRRHRLVILDHHASSVDQLAAQGLVPAIGEPDERWPHLKWFVAEDPGVVLLVDETRCATRMAADHRALYVPPDPVDGAAPPNATAPAAALATLVEAIDAVDLWKKDRAIFRQALVLDEVFWDNVSGYIPLGHPWHDRFVGELLLGMAARLGGGAVPAEIERDAGALRAGIVDAMLADQPDDDRSATTRMRLAPLLARSPALFHKLTGGARLSFALDAGTFQRVSDALMASRSAALVINVQRSGSMSFRSNDETALATARVFRGGGHKDAAGGRLPSGGATSLADAVAQVEALLHPPASTPSASPFAALQGFKA